MWDINNTNKYGATALQGDRTKAKLEIFRYLKEIVANINITIGQIQQHSSSLRC